MEKWGADLYGQPCRECGFDWSLTPGEAVALVASIAMRFDERLAGATGKERHPELRWSASAYVCHVGDNLRIWAERLTGARMGGAAVVPEYDPDQIAEARRYDEIPPASALWSLGWAAREWVEAVEEALAADVVLGHETRGVIRASDVARNNAHDAHHHLHDVTKTLDVAPV